MTPAFMPGMVVLARQKSVSPGDVVIAEMGGREVLKRVKNEKAGKFYLVGDNTLESTDSREFGSVGKAAIKGVVFATLPQANYEERSPRRSVVSLSFAAIILPMLAAQLVRFDTFIPILDDLFTAPVALAVGSSMVVLELFALPFLLGMALSPLGRVISMLCGWAVSIGWLAWGFLSLSAKETGHLGSFVTLRPGAWAVVFGLILVILTVVIAWQYLRENTARRMLKI